MTKIKNKLSEVRVFKVKQKTGNGEVSEVLSCAGRRRVARALKPASRDALRREASVHEKRTLYSGMPAPGNGHTHEARSHAAVNGRNTG